MRDLYKQAEKFLNLIEKFESEHVGNGKMVRSLDALTALDSIIKKGLKFYNNVIAESELIQKNTALAAISMHIQEYANKLVINDENAKKLTLENSLIIWQQLEVALALFASTVMDLLAEEGN